MACVMRQLSSKPKPNGPSPQTESKQKHQVLSSSNYNRVIKDENRLHYLPKHNKIASNSSFWISIHWQTSSQKIKNRLNMNPTGAIVSWYSRNNWTTTKTGKISNHKKFKRTYHSWKQKDEASNNLNDWDPEAAAFSTRHLVN